MKPATLETGNQIPLLQTLDIHLEEIGPKHAVMRVTVGTKHLNYFGGAHGGLIATLIDTACFFPASMLPAGRLVTTSNLNIQYLRPAGPGDELTARAELLHLGRRTASLSIAVTNQSGALVAQGSATLQVLAEPGPTDGAAATVEP
jgi:acyl-CoA thioesterase